MNPVEQYHSSESDDDDHDEFEDAEDTPIENDMTIDRALAESQRAINYFFNNQFNEAKDLMTPYSNSSMYHSLGYSIFLFMEAILTFEPEATVAASKALKNSLGVCNKSRRKNTIGESIGKIVKRAHFDQYTELEAHAELCHAESLLLKAMLTFMEDETLSSFIKAGLKIRSCFNSYKDCRQILLKRDWHGDNSKNHFESGVRMGVGAFNLMISMLPSKIVKLLEFIGFSGNKQNGLNDLTIGCKLNGLRQLMCIMTMLGYNLVVLPVLSHKEGDMEMCKEIIDDQLKKHPESVWFLFFQGRVNLLFGELQASQEMYTRSWKSQNIWPQFHHICYWELVWVHCLKTEWREALYYCTQLIEKSKWSRSLYSYQKAVIMCALKNELTQSELDQINQLMRDVPKYKQRIAGKSLPMEKFAMKRAARYFNQNCSLALPVIELMFLWNLFKIFKKKSVGTEILKLIEKSLADIDSNTKPSKYDYDNKALILLLQGSCLRNMGSPLLALECLESVISMQKNLVEDHFIIPYAILELALAEWQQGNKDKAILALEDAKKNYTGYSLESRLHFRIHTSLSEFKAEMKLC
ncbi:tetratricopeptide repeat protein 39B-like [Leptinotarsa decemlineata]|uniref:tetratricopeptide repeat protein 39B-like n=1 Tax=Leptinotarsa decemlineata TaxID=7539 RepID=UPI003D309B41